MAAMTPFKQHPLKLHAYINWTDFFVLDQACGREPSPSPDSVFARKLKGKTGTIIRRSLIKYA